MESRSALPHRVQPQEARIQRSVLPVRLPPATLRPVAFRIFTRKHDLTLTSAALNLLADLIGKQCGSTWRDTGLAEKVLEEVAQAWKKASPAVIVEGSAPSFNKILQSLDLRLKQGSLDAEQSYHGPSLGQRRQQPATTEDKAQIAPPPAQDAAPRRDPRHWLKVVDAFEQPRLDFSPITNQFQQVTRKRSAFPDPAAKTALFRSQYALVHHRLQRSMSSRLQRPVGSASGEPGSDTASPEVVQPYKLTAIANMLGRGGTRHVLLGLLVETATGSLAISDLSGSVLLDLHKAMQVPADGAWFASGLFVIVEGIYVGEESSATLGGREGVGGNIGGKFLGLSIGGPPCERRDHTLGSGERCGDVSTWFESSGAGFGWVDFLGLGSEKVNATRMRTQEKELLQLRARNTGRTRVVALGELDLSNPKTLQALRKTMSYYAQEDTASLPMAFVLAGNFARHAVLAGDEKDSRASYVDLFDSLASVLFEFPLVLRAARFIFLPGDRDPWESASSGGAAAPLPRKPIPEVFTAKVRKVFSSANSEIGASPDTDLSGDAVWTTNPSRLSFLSNVHEMVLFRDDFSGRMRRGAIRLASVDGLQSHASAPGRNDQLESLRKRLDPSKAPLSGDLAGALAGSAAADPTPKDAGTKSDLEVSRKLVKTVLDQGNLSPFPTQRRPVLWDTADALRLFPLPTALFLIDPEAPAFGITYEGCHVMNPGRLIPDGRRNVARWVEYDALTRRSQILEQAF